MYAKIDAYIQKLLDCSTPDAPIWNIESIRQGKKPHWNYIDGCMIKAILEMYSITGKEKYRDFAESYISHRVKEDGSIDQQAVKVYAAAVCQKIADKIAQEQGTGIYYKGAMDRIPGINA